MTHPAQPPRAAWTLAEALSRISTDERSRMCLSVNLAFGNREASRLLDLFHAADAQAAHLTLPLDMTGRRWSVGKIFGDVFEDDDYDGHVLQIEIRTPEEAAAIEAAMTGEST